VAQPNTHCQYFWPATLALVVAADHAGLAQLRGDVGDRGVHLLLGAREDVGDRALADRQAEHILHQRRQALKADRVDAVQVDHLLLDAAPEGRPRLQALRWPRGKALTAARTFALVLMDAGNVRAHRRDLDPVVAELEGLVLGTNVPAATRAVAGRRGNRAVRVRLQGPRLTLATLARLAGFAFAPLVRLLVLRRGQRGVPRVLARLVHLGLKVGHPLLQRHDVVGQFVLGMLLQLFPPSHTILESYQSPAVKSGSWGCTAGKILADDKGG
jgi:hypothetical protein